MCVTWYVILECDMVRYSFFVTWYAIHVWRGTLYMCVTWYVIPECDMVRYSCLWRGTLYMCDVIRYTCVWHGTLFLFVTWYIIDVWRGTLYLCVTWYVLHVRNMVRFTYVVVPTTCDIIPQSLWWRLYLNSCACDCFCLHMTCTFHVTYISINEMYSVNNRFNNLPRYEESGYLFTCACS